ncbi:MAG: TIGR04282 family arsenosugar biosynthesis glycosyltransferase [Anaerolineae bacterium]
MNDLEVNVKSGLIIMAKAPVPGAVKTRLCPPYTFEEAAELCRCFLLDTFDLVSRLRRVPVAVAYSPPGAEGIFRSMASPAFHLLPQRGNDLGERLNGAFEQLFALGYEAVVAMGADSPTLPLDYIEQSFASLASKENDLVLGPSADGGYYLIGMKAFHPELFQGVAMGTERVLSQTLERARRTNLRVSLLPPWYDVDTQDDLERLRAELRAAPQVAMHTRAFLSMREVF